MQLPYSNTKITHWNEGATMPLILPVHLICNTDDDQIYNNIRANTLADREWVKVSPEHDKVAVLCGSAPSLADNIENIRQRANRGEIIFALNGAASYLAKHGIIADYQVMIDARPETADLIGEAKEHLFASQCAPVCFEKKPQAKLWHLHVHNIEDCFPEYNKSKGYALIGGAASVGNTATCLAYAMGFRNLQLYGYDSSHRDGASHAFHQKMNDGEPCACVTFNGKEYIASLTMKLQAEKFQDTARALRQYGCHIEVHGDGLLPDMWNAPKEVMTEAEKYEKMWEIDAYRGTAPAEHCAPIFLRELKPKGTVIDFGCGTGRGAYLIHQAGNPVILVDFTENSRDENIKSLPFIKKDLIKPIDLYAPYGFCTDVMEHIEPHNVEVVIKNIMDCVDTCFFQISTVPDVMGAEIGQDLHLTVKPHVWWHDLFVSLGYKVNWDKDLEIASMFIVVK